MHINRNTKIVFIIALVCFVSASVALAWFLFIINTSGKDLTQQVALIAQKNAAMQQHAELSELTKQTKAQREALEQFVLTEEQTSTFLTEVENLSETLGVTLTTNTLEVVPQKDTFDRLVLEFTVEGGEEGVKQIISIFETLPYHSQITSMTYTKQEETSETVATLSMFITLSDHEQ